MISRITGMLNHVYTVTGGTGDLTGVHGRVDVHGTITGDNYKGNYWGELFFEE